MCRISGLSEHFVYFNDDFFLTSDSPRSVFFDANGLPKDSAVQNIISCDGASPMLTSVANNLHLLNINFNKHAVMKRNAWICINDGQDNHFEQSKAMLEESFKKILPEKCSFEK